ncbi:uncharacterized protein O3C94_016718 isoform 2-T2 [Discoglossus pictus]
MTKDSKIEKMIEKFLNQALEMIYLLTGEEYTIMKKNSPHSHHLTGKVPVKCDDVAVYFSMEEWEYIERNKELYKDMISVYTKGTHDKNPDPVSINVDQTEEQEENVRHNVGIQSEPCTGLQEDNTENVADSETGQDKGEETNTFFVEIHPVSCAGNNNTDIVQSVEQIVETSVRSQQEAHEKEMEERTSKDERMSRNMLEGSQTASCSSEKIERNNTSLSQRVYGIGKRKSSQDSSSCDKGRLTSTSRFSAYEVQNEKLKKKSKSKKKTRAAKYAKEDNKGVIRESKALVVSQQTNTERQKNLTTKSSLVAHKKTYKGEMPQICSERGKGFSKKSLLVKHQIIHTGEKPYTCQQCGKTFSGRSGLHYHNRIHAGEKPFVCQQCGKRFSIKASLTTHYRIHTGEKPYICPQCGKAFSGRSGLDYHNKTHTGEKPFVCHRCGKRFSVNASLTTHYRVHTGEKPYTCQRCGKAFSDKSTLHYHNRIHTGEKPFVCQRCGKRFSVNTRLTTHYRIHTGEKPYICQHCGRAFSDKSNMAAHSKIHTTN